MKVKKTSSPKVIARANRKQHIRKRVFGTAEKPRLSVFRSTTHIYAQVIDDSAHRTLASASTKDKGVAATLTGMKKKEQARKVGELVAQRCKEKSITQVVFDRNGFIYHGRVQALADGAREGGLQF